MPTSLLPVWGQIESWLDNGFSIVPCYDQNAEDKSKIKKPCIKWKDYQERIIDKETLFKLMDEKFQTTAVCVIAGKVSGNLECIDIDVKNWAGVDAMYFTQIKALFPDLWNRLRIHRSPSGGFHILYRIVDHEPEGNQKLCKKIGMKLAAIETRGEGGYLLVPPSVGYTIYKDEPIPTLTWSERCSLVAIAQGFNEDTPQPKQQFTQSTKQVSAYYDETPIEHFNRSERAETILLEHGWKFLKKTHQFIYFERPDQTETGRVAASFNLQKRVYYIFTSSTQLEPDRGYLPSTILLILSMGGDKKKTYKYLVNEGYGRVKPEAERELAKRIINKGKDVSEAMPANMSEEGRRMAIDMQGRLLSAHPHGIFWQVDSEDDTKFEIDREKLYQVADGLGFRLYDGALIYIEDDHFLKEVDERFFFDALKEYIRDDDDLEVLREINNTYEVFIERHGKFTITRLPIIQPEFILQDGRDVCYKFYQNCFIEITAYEVKERKYEELTHFVWRKNIQPRNWVSDGEMGGKYVDFVRLALGGLSTYIKKCIGFLSHQFKDETTGYIVTLTEQCENPEDGGGSGKNVFCTLFKYTTTFTSKPGSQIKFDEKFLQSWNGEKIFCISDAPRSFDFAFLKELSTGDGLLKKLFKDEATVMSEKMPKFLIQTNYSYEIKDGGIKRRVMPIEFTDFFTLAGGVDVHYGAHFPKDWTHDDWVGYDHFMSVCVQEWLAGGLKLHAPTLTEGGWAKQFKLTYGQGVYDFIAQNFEQFKTDCWVSNEIFNEKLLHFYNENNIAPQFRTSSTKLNKALKSYFEHHGLHFYANKVRRDSAGTERGREFGPEIDPPF